jgi:predicted  nucleic acid-binding Zn-ribbon protein
MSQPLKLFRLQQVDSQLDKITKRLKQIEIALKDDIVLQQARKQAEAKLTTLRSALSAVKKAEASVSSHQTKIQINQSALYGGKIKNPKELLDLQNEAGALQRYMLVLEERQLEEMIALDDAEKENIVAQEKLKEEELIFKNQISELILEKDELLKEEKRLESQRSAALAGIPSDDITLYKKLREIKGGVAVTRVEENTCNACGTRLPKALVQSARSPKKISRCDTCNRILYA